MNGATGAARPCCFSVSAGRRRRTSLFVASNCLLLATYYLLLTTRYSLLTSRSNAVVPLLREAGPVLSSLCPRSLPGSIASLTRFLSSLFSGKRPCSAREKRTTSPSLVSRVTSKVPSPDAVQRERGRARLEGALSSGPGCAPGRGRAPCALRGRPKRVVAVGEPTCTGGACLGGLG